MSFEQERLLRWREEFDSSFALPPRTETRDLDSFLGIRVEGSPWVFRIHDIGSVLPRQKTVRLMTRQPALLGLTGHRGRLVAVYSLPSLLGMGSGSRELRWTLVSAHARDLAFAVEALDGFLQAPRTDGGIVTLDGEARSVVDTASIIREIHKG